MALKAVQLQLKERENKGGLDNCIAPKTDKGWSEGARKGRIRQPLIMNGMRTMDEQTVAIVTGPCLHPHFVVSSAPRIECNFSGLLLCSSDESAFLKRRDDTFLLLFYIFQFQQKAFKKTTYESFKNRKNRVIQFMFRGRKKLR